MSAEQISSPIDEIRHNISVFSGYKRQMAPSPFKPLRNGEVRHSFKTDEGLRLVMDSIDELEKVTTSGIQIDDRFKELSPFAHKIEANWLTKLNTRTNLSDTANYSMGQAILATVLKDPAVMPALSAMLEIAGEPGINIASNDLQQFEKIAKEVTAPHTVNFDSVLFEHIVRIEKDSSIKAMASILQNSSQDFDLKSYHGSLQQERITYDPQTATAVFHLAESLGKGNISLLQSYYLRMFRELQNTAKDGFYGGGDFQQGLAITNFFLELEKIKLMKPERFRGPIKTINGEKNIEIPCLGRGVVSIIYRGMIDAINKTIEDKDVDKAYHLFSKPYYSSQFHFPSDDMNFFFSVFENRLLKDFDSPDPNAEEITKSLADELISVTKQLPSRQFRKETNNILHGLLAN